MDPFFTGIVCGIVGVGLLTAIVVFLREYRRRGRQNTEDYFKIARLEKDVEWHKTAHDNTRRNLTDQRDSAVAQNGNLLAKLKAAGIE